MEEYQAVCFVENICVGVNILAKLLKLLEGPCISFSLKISCMHFRERLKIWTNTHFLSLNVIFLRQFLIGPTISMCPKREIYWQYLDQRGINEIWTYFHWYYVIQFRPRGSWYCDSMKLGIFFSFLRLFDRTFGTPSVTKETSY